MSFFMAWSAFKAVPSDRVVQEVLCYLESHGTEAETMAADPWKASSEENLLVYDRKPWVIIQWPEKFLSSDVPLCIAVTRTLGALSSTNMISDDDVWRHALVEQGSVIDRFANRPDYYCDTPEQAELLKERLRGNPEIVARAFGVDPDLVRRYFVHLGMDELIKAFPDDEEHLGSPWSFRDLWRRVGIIIPRDGKGCVAGFRLVGDWDRKLPRASDFAV